MTCPLNAGAEPVDVTVLDLAKRVRRQTGSKSTLCVRRLSCEGLNEPIAYVKRVL